MRVKNEPLPESNRLRTPRESMQAQSRRNAVINQLSKSVRHVKTTMRREPKLGGIEADWFQLRSVYREHLVCYKIKWSADGSGYSVDSAEVLVAKPWILRASSYHNKTYGNRKYIQIDSVSYPGLVATTRYVTYDPGGDNETSEYQMIIPIYQVPITDDNYPGDLIYAIKTVTGVFVTEDDYIGGGGIALDDGPTGKVEWLDINTDARMWAGGTEEFEIPED